jgi:hypothetical protein
LWAEIGNDATDLAHEAWDCLLGRLAQMRLEFANPENAPLGANIVQGADISWD